MGFKIESGHGPIIKTLAKSCKGVASKWCKVLLFALWDNRTYSFVIGYMPIEQWLGLVIRGSLKQTYGSNIQRLRCGLTNI